MSSKLSIMPLLFAVLLAGAVAVAADHSRVVPFVTDDVVAIAYLELKAVDPSAILDELRDSGAMPQEQADNAAMAALTAQGWFDKLTENGATFAYALLRLSDVPHGGPSWALPLSGDAKPDNLIDLLQATQGGPKLWRHANGVLLGAMDEAQIEALVTVPPDKQRPELVAALAQLGDGDAGLVVLGDADSRRVLREMFPRLSAPFAQIDGRLIADHLLWGGAAIDLPPQPRATIHMQTSGVEIAETLQQAAVNGLELAKQMTITQLADASPEVSPADIQKVLGMLAPTVETTAVRLTLGGDAEQLAGFRKLLMPPIVAARMKAERIRRINQLRQLALAALNYESANGTLPQQASYDAAGRPLLSWRVHVLPYLEEMALYKEFHLEEPWDSPHNRTLIARMPVVYADPSAAVRRAVGDVGRTTFLAPVAAETVFPPRKSLPEGEPLKFKDLTDGSSKTILFVEVVPERAVVWTKPEDWNVDLGSALKGLQRADRTFFTIALCDGSVHALPNDTSAQTLRAMLTRDGGESVER